MNNYKISPLISVVVPVYNSEKYLHRCIDSILSQTYKNLEVLLIDDESPDSSGKICDEYAEKDQRVTVIHQKNMGTGPTRAKGVEIAHGDYIAFVDNDDYILPDMYETMLKVIIMNEADVCACQWNYEYKDGSRVFTKDNKNTKMLGIHNSVEWEKFLYRDVLSGSINAWYHNGMVCLVWNKLYKRDLLVGFSASRDRAEDDELNDFVNSQRCKIVVIPQEFYIWCENQQSVSHQKFSDKNLHALTMFYRRINRFSFDPFLVRETKKLYINMYIEYYFRAQSNNVNYPIEFRRWFVTIFIDLIKKLDLSIPTIFRVILFMISPFLYQRITRIGL